MRSGSNIDTGITLLQVAAKTLGLDKSKRMLPPHDISVDDLSEKSIQKQDIILWLLMFKIAKDC